MQRRPKTRSSARSSGRDWITDRTHGLQSKADFLKTTPPTTAKGIEKYLGSGMVRGIGPKLAGRIVAVFGAATFEIIEASPEKLRHVSGIGKFRAAKIAAGWVEQKAIRNTSGGLGTLCEKFAGRMRTLNYRTIYPDRRWVLDGLRMEDSWRPSAR